MMTSISPWIVTAEALAPFAAPARKRAPGKGAARTPDGCQRCSSDYL